MLPSCETAAETAEREEQVTDLVANHIMPAAYAAGIVNDVLLLLAAADQARMAKNRYKKAAKRVRMIKKRAASAAI